MCFCPRADDWMVTAVDCLEFLPDELVVEVSRGMSGCASDLPQCKRLMYEVLAQHYGHAQQPPLLSNHVFDIHSGISELLGTIRPLFAFGVFVAMPEGHSSNPASLFLSVISKRKAGSGCRDPPAEPEAAGLPQQGGASPAPEVHGHRGQTPGDQTAQRGESWRPRPDWCRHPFEPCSH